MSESRNYENAVMIPYYAHEGEMVRMERLNRRWFIAFLIVLTMLFATNIAWIIYENQFEDSVTTIEQQGETDGGGNNYFNGTGELTFYGEREAAGDGQNTGEKISR